MQYLILSDMHGNAEALQAVLRRVRRKRFDAVLVLGDLVGYGAGPNQVVEAMRDLPGSVYRIRGNHDKVVAGIEDGANFNHAALRGLRQPLCQRPFRWLAELCGWPAAGHRCPCRCMAGGGDRSRRLRRVRDSVKTSRNVE